MFDEVKNPEIRKALYKAVLIMTVTLFVTFMYSFLCLNSLRREMETLHSNIQEMPSIEEFSKLQQQVEILESSAVTTEELEAFQREIDSRIEQLEVVLKEDGLSANEVDSILKILKDRESSILRQVSLWSGGYITVNTFFLDMEDIPSIEIKGEIPLNEDTPNVLASAPLTLIVDGEEIELGDRVQAGDYVTVFPLGGPENQLQIQVEPGFRSTPTEPYDFILE